MGFQLPETYTNEFETIQCSVCAIVFAVPELFREKRHQDHGTFYCPNGHSQYFPQKSEAEKLRDELSQVQREKAKITEQLWAEQRERQRLEKRVKGGVCPCCKRSFVGLAKHMKTKHPEYPGKKD